MYGGQGKIFAEAKDHASFKIAKNLLGKLKEKAKTIGKEKLDDLKEIVKKEVE